MKMRQLALLCISLQGAASTSAMQKAASIPQYPSLSQAFYNNILKIRNYNRTDWMKLFSYPHFGEGELSISDCLDSRAREGLRNDSHNIKELWKQPGRRELLLALLQNKVQSKDSASPSASVAPALSVAQGAASASAMQKEGYQYASPREAIRAIRNYNRTDWMNLFSQTGGAIYKNILKVRNYDWMNLFSYPHFGENELSISGASAADTVPTPGRFMRFLGGEGRLPLSHCLDSCAREGFRNASHDIKLLWKQPKRLGLFLALLQNKVKWVDSRSRSSSSTSPYKVKWKGSASPSASLTPPSVLPGLSMPSVAPPLLPHASSHQPPRAAGLIGLIDRTIGFHSYFHHFFSTISHVVATNFNLTPEGIERLGNSVANLLHGPDSPGQRLLRELGNLARQDGELRETINDVVGMFRELISDGGEVQATIAAALQTFRDNARNVNVELRTAAMDFAATYADLVRDVTDVIHDQGDKFIVTAKGHTIDFAIITVATLAAIFTTYHGSRVLMNYLDRYLMIPKLILESSEKSLWERISGIFSKEKELPDLIFSPELKTRLDNIIAATQNIRAKIEDGQTNVKYRNLLLWGPPGTGKTLFAKTLALESGMDYAMMSGSSFAQFKDGQGITEMNKLFEWAQRSKGLLLFIDEAESFLGGREGQNVTDEPYQLLTNFLKHTGERSDKFMIVFATNKPKLIDKAMGRRVDDSVEITLPTQAERMAILELYRKMILLDVEQNSPEFINSVETYLSDKDIELVAQKTEGLSGGELEGVINSIITDAAITDTGLVTKPLIDMVVDQAIRKHREFAREFTGVTQEAAAA